MQIKNLFHSFALRREIFRDYLFMPMQNGGTEIFMRLDKYLKVSRIIKRRTVANEACSLDKVMVNSRIVKPSYNLSIGDVIEIKFGDKLLKAEVVSLDEKASKKDASTLYKIIQ